MSKFDIEDIEEILIKAGEVAIENYGNVANQGKSQELRRNEDSDYIEGKAAFSFVDAKVQKIIMDGMYGLYPNLGIIVEETDEGIVERLKNFRHTNGFVDGEYTLTIDPIDGTRNYLSATPGSKDYEKFKEKRNFWGVSLGIFHGTGPVVGVIYYPVLGKGFVLKTEKGSGTFVHGQKIRVEENQNFSEEDMVRVSGAIAGHDLNLRKYFPSENGRSSGSYVVTLLSLLQGGGQEEIGALFGENLISYQGYIGQNVDVLDLGGCSLAYEEAGGFIGDIDGNAINPVVNWNYNDKRKAVIIDRPFIISPNKKYLNSLIGYLKESGVNLETL